LRDVLLSAKEMFKAEQLAMSHGIAGLELMEAAGRAVADAVMAARQPGAALVLCGPGNNGGDGFVAARRLMAAGWRVDLALLGARDALKGDAAVMAARWLGQVAELTPGVIADQDVIIDALFGTGLGRPLDGVAAAVAERVNAAAAYKVAVDIPSGIDSDSGAVADIGIAEDVLTIIRPRLHENHPGRWLRSWPWPEPMGHKYRRGHAVVVSGPLSCTGAAALAARSALRVGAGLVTVACTNDALPALAAKLDAVMTAPFGDLKAFRRFIGDARRNAVLLGPGNGVTKATRARVLATLDEAKRTVLDADALTVFAGDPQALFKAIGEEEVAITPHEGEFARLFPDLSDRISTASKAVRAIHAAERAGAVVVLKGPDTVVAAPDGSAVINTNAPATLATAGAGDVLSGLIVGLLAQGMPAFDAACGAAWLHGAAAAKFGPGLTADDLPGLVPAVLADLAALKGRT
jgi:NAD(P)H-hydrate epimerase